MDSLAPEDSLYSTKMVPPVRSAIAQSVLPSTSEDILIEMKKLPQRAIDQTGVTVSPRSSLAVRQKTISKWKLFRATVETAVPMQLSHPDVFQATMPESRTQDLAGAYVLQGRLPV